MKISKSGATFSSIVGIGQEIKKMSRQDGKEYLYLNRGINNVVKINLNSVVGTINFNTDEMQFYTPTFGKPELRKAINNEYFAGKADSENIFVTVGGMHALSLVFSILNFKKFFTYKYFWGSYSKILQIENKEIDFYESYNQILESPARFSDSVVIICDPNNPTGEKYPDDLLIRVIEQLKDVNSVVVWDSPYRRLFYENDDDLYIKLLKFDNVIVSESFSKSIGLSGQRLGFIHSSNQDFNAELGIRLLYSVNGVNAFSQILVEKILGDPYGQKAARDYRQKTVHDIRLNIEFLRKNGLLAEAIYGNTCPVGIFAIVNKTYDQLISAQIGSVPMSFFTRSKDPEIQSASRICVSVPHEKFVGFFSKIR